MLPRVAHAIPTLVPDIIERALDRLRLDEGRSREARSRSSLVLLCVHDRAEARLRADGDVRAVIAAVAADGDGSPDDPDNPATTTI